MTYRPHPIDLDNGKLPECITPEIIEDLAKESHDRWAADRISEGYTYGPVDDSNLKTNTRLVEYEKLPIEVKQENRRQIIDALRLSDLFGYTVEPKDAPSKSAVKKADSAPKYWDYAEKNYWDIPYKYDAQPEYRLPVVLGLLAQNTDYEWNSVKKALDKLVSVNLKNYKLNVNDRSTPFYLLTEKSSQLEHLAADYLCEEYKMRCITIIDDHSAPPQGEHYVRSNDASGYIAKNCFALIALWDGLSSGNDHEAIRCCSTIRNTLCENCGITPFSTECEANIGDTRPVFNILLPSAISRSRDMCYKVRDLLPHILEVGENWFYLDRQDPDNVVDYLDNFKKDHFNETVSSTIKLNRIISRPEKAAKMPVYDLLDEPLHGLNKAADAANMRFLRLDTLASKQQNSYKRTIILASLLSFIGLLAFAVLDDLGDIIDIHSFVGAALGLLSAGALIAALILLFISGSRRLSLNLAHSNLRLLSECMRVQTYWNITGLSDHNADEGMNARARTEVGFALRALRGWRVLDEAAGYYRDCNCQPIFIDANVYNWLGAADSKSALRYTRAGTKHSQSIYAYNACLRECDKSHKHETKTKAAEIFAIALMLIFSGLLVYKYFKSAGSGTFTLTDLSSLFEPIYKSGGIVSILESAAMFFISIIPAAAGCYFLYASSRKHSENAGRYRWLTLQYKKLVWEYKQQSDKADRLPKDASLQQIREINAVKQNILLRAGKVGVNEACYWSCLMQNSDVDVNFV